MASSEPDELCALHLQEDYFEFFEFHVEGILATGRSGQVFLASSKKYQGITRAVKIISTKTGDLKMRGLTLEQVKEAFYREVGILKYINHQYILSGVNGVVCPDYLALTMDYCNHGTLASRMRVVDDGKMYVLTKCLIKAIEFLHSRRIVHGDIKPTKILLIGEGLQLRPVVAGFSAAYRLPQHCNLVSTYGKTAGFIAPEAKKKTDYVDPLKCDSFAVGTVMWCMIQRRCPPDFTKNYAAEALHYPIVSDLIRYLLLALLCDDPTRRIPMTEALRLINIISLEDCKPDLRSSLQPER